MVAIGTNWSQWRPHRRSQKGPKQPKYVIVYGDGSLGALFLKLLASRLQSPITSETVRQYGRLLWYSVDAFCGGCCSLLRIIKGMRGVQNTLSLSEYRCKKCCKTKKITNLGSFWPSWWFVWGLHCIDSNGPHLKGNQRISHFNALISKYPHQSLL